MGSYLLDTCALSAYFNEEHKFHAPTKSTIDGLRTEDAVLVSSISLAELEYGIRLAEARQGKRLDEFRERLVTIRQYGKLAVTDLTAPVYAELKASIAATRLKANGKKMPRYLEDWIESATGKKLQLDENDLWICAQAKERDLTIITADPDFRAFASADPNIKLILCN
jgi:predicted nucleic acid-binding protein